MSDASIIAQILEPINGLLATKYISGKVMADSTSAGRLTLYSCRVDLRHLRYSSHLVVGMGGDMETQAQYVDVNDVHLCKIRLDRWLVVHWLR